MSGELCPEMADPPGFCHFDCRIDLGLSSSKLNIFVRENIEIRLLLMISGL
jgi:hypothetical protein